LWSILPSEGLRQIAQKHESPPFWKLLSV
jgi:hypothetical protein